MDRTHQDNVDQLRNMYPDELEVYSDEAIANSYQDYLQTIIRTKRLPSLKSGFICCLHTKMNCVIKMSNLYAYEGSHT